jgi:hypothetical protein
VLLMQFPVGHDARAVGAGVAPPVEQVAPLSVPAAAVARGLGPGGGVVDHPDLVDRVDADHELVELRVVRHGIDVEPVRDPRIGGRTDEVEVDQFRVIQ